jgi:SAM-dependent methyltransferase
MEMMKVARDQVGPTKGVQGYVRADAERLPFADDSFDCVMAIRFLFHVDARTRQTILAEMARVSRRWLILDYRHKYAYRYFAWKVKRLLRLTRTPMDRIGRLDLECELWGAGIRLVKILPVAQVFSDKWIVIGEKSISPTS